ncbi:MAG: class I SAM-dependent methyltransferase [Firmicutes bacterium]|nr:class I SAM-dependent methyltransferase [Bacillota bacterium]
MSVSTSFIKWTNHIFPQVVHPFNLQNNGRQTYAEWQFAKGEDTVRLFLDRYSLDEMFLHKRVLDMGCGAAGKSLYYVKCGADHVTGVDIVPHYREEALALAKKLSFDGKFTFAVASACALPFADNSFDTIIMNDFMEHVSQPRQALAEARRLLTPEGRIFINFPPYYHPFGAHLSDTINMPWVHLFFREKTLVAAYKDLIRGLPDEAERLQLKIGLDGQGREAFTYINKMTLKKFKSMLQDMGITPQYYREAPLRSYFKLLARTPLLKEMFVKMAVCVIGK